MSKFPTPIESTALETVTGGGALRRGGSTSDIDGLIGQLNSLTSSIKDIKQKTNGFGTGEMLILCMLAMQQHQPSGVVYVGAPRRCWW
jgi:hypothetical protein